MKGRVLIIVKKMRGIIKNCKTDGEREEERERERVGNMIHKMSDWTSDRARKLQRDSVANKAEDYREN